jgi:hypothetical protein
MLEVRSRACANVGARREMIERASRKNTRRALVIDATNEFNTASAA